MVVFQSMQASVIDCPYTSTWGNVKRFRGGLVTKAHRWLYHATLGSRVIKKKKRHLGTRGKRPEIRAAAKRTGNNFKG